MYHKDPEKVKEINMKDSEVRIALEEKPVTQTKEEATAASKFKFKRDLEMHRFLTQLKMTTNPQ